MCVEPTTATSLAASFAALLPPPPPPHAASARTSRDRRMSYRVPMWMHRKKRAQAAWRAASIASTNSSAPPNSSPRSVTSRLPDEYTAVSTRSRSARSSPEPRTTGPTVARPPRKTRKSAPRTASLSFASWIANRLATGSGSGPKRSSVEMRELVQLVLVLDERDAAVQVDLERLGRRCTPPGRTRRCARRPVRAA